MTPKDIYAKRDALMAELQKLSRVLGLANTPAQVERNRRIGEIRAEINALPQQVTGEAAGIIQIGGFLGDPWTPPPREASEADRRKAEDPFWQYAIESGQAPE